MASSDDGVRYRDKVTIVTGGCQGIGRGCVELFVKHGSTVIIADIKDDLGNELEKNLNQEGRPGKAIYIRCDVMKEEEIKNLIQTTVDKFGGIDCVVNNAGTSLGQRLIDTCPADDFRFLLELNLIAPFQVSKYALKHIREAKGNIINIASMSGVLGQGNVMPYTASKSGLIGLTMAMAVDESIHGVRVNSVSPCAVETPLLTGFAHTFPNADKMYEYMTNHAQYMDRLCHPEDVAKACLYLATDATYSTGQNVYVSGGCELDYGFKANMDFFFEK